MKDFNSSGVSIVIPAYNEIQSIRTSIEQISKAMAETDIDFEIIIVDDGSKDGTGEAAAKFSKVKVISHEQNRGYGASLKTGVQRSTHDLVCIVDADGTYPVAQIPCLVNKLLDEQCDMVVAARTGTQVDIPFVRRPAKWVLSKLANYLTGTRIPDLNSGLRVMKKNVVNRFLNILPDGFSFTTTITLAMLTNGYLVKYVSINYAKRKGTSKIRPIYDTMNFFQLILRTILYFQPLKIFMPVSLLFFSAGLALLVYRIFVEKAFSVTIVLFFVTGVQLLAMGMLADMINKRIK